MVLEMSVMVMYENNMVVKVMFSFIDVNMRFICWLSKLLFLLIFE